VDCGLSLAGWSLRVVVGCRGRTSANGVKPKRPSSVSYPIPCAADSTPDLPLGFEAARTTPIARAVLNTDLDFWVSNGETARARKDDAGAVATAWIIMGAAVAVMDIVLAGVGGSAWCAESRGALRGMMKLCQSPLYFKG